MRDIRQLFPTDDPVGPELLIGRGQDVDQLARRLATGTHAVIAGPRRTGKSSVALAALARLRESGVYTAHVDLWDHEDLDSLTSALARAILANRSSFAKALSRAADTGRELRELLPAAVTATLRSHLGEDVELAWRAPARHDSRARAMPSVISLAQRIAEQDGKRIVLFLDEFQDIASKPPRFGDPELLSKQLRAELQRSPLVSVLFAGSIEHLMRELFGPSRRALSQFGSFYELSPIAPEEWRAGIASRYSELGVSAAEETIAEVVSLGEGHPRTSMLIARETMIVALAREKTRAIELADARTGFELALQADRLRHEDIVQRLRSTSHAYSIALRVARGERPYSGNAPAATRRALATIERAGIAEHRARADWLISDPLLRSYLASRA